MAGRARGPAAPAPHLASGGPPAQKSRPGTGTVGLWAVGGCGGWEGLAGLEETRPWRRAVWMPAAQCLSSSSLPHFGFYLPVPSHLLSISTGLTPYLHSRITVPFVGDSDSKASVYNAGDPGSIPGSGRSPGEGNGNPLQFYCLENPLD